MACLEEKVVMLYWDLQGVVGNAVLQHQQKCLLSCAFQSHCSSHFTLLNSLEPASAQACQLWHDNVRTGKTVSPASHPKENHLCHMAVSCTLTKVCQRAHYQACSPGDTHLHKTVVVQLRYPLFPPSHPLHIFSYSQGQ